MTTIRPVDKDSKDVRITLRLAGSKQTENRKRTAFQTYADVLAEILAANARGMRTSDASVLPPVLRPVTPPCSRPCSRP